MESSKKFSEQKLAFLKPQKQKKLSNKQVLIHLYYIFYNCLNSSCLD